MICLSKDSYNLFLISFYLAILILMDILYQIVFDCKLESLLKYNLKESLYLKVFYSKLESLLSNYKSSNYI